MLKKLMSGICVLCMVSCLMVGCSSTEDADENNDLEAAYKIANEKLEDMKEREGEDILGEYGTDELVMKDDKLVLNLIFDEGMNEDIAVLDESDWNDLIDDFTEACAFVEDKINEEGYDVDFEIDIYVENSDIIITRINKNEIIESNYNEYKSQLIERNNNKAKNTETRENKSNTNDENKEYQETNSKFYIGNDGCYHCLKCNHIPSKEEYNNNVCDNCKNGGEKIHQCNHCYAYIEPGHEYTINGVIYCEQCAIELQNAELEEEWVCPDCGRTNIGDVLCECELEEGNY